MKYIDADKLLDIIIKMRKEYATQEVTEDHKGLRAVLGGQCLVLTEIIEIVDSLQQEQPEVDLEEYIENEINHYGLFLYGASYGTFSASQIDRIIRNAFELGFNARKK